MSYSDSSYGVFQGQLFAASRAMNGAQTSGFIFLGDVEEFKINPKQKFEDISESQTGMGLQSAHIPVETMLSVSMKAIDTKAANWVKAVWGTDHGAVAGGTVTAEALTLYDDFGITPLLHPGVSSVVLKQASTTLSATTDYELDPTNGTVKARSGNAITFTSHKATLAVDYTYAAYTGKVDAFTSGQQIYALRLQGINTANSNQPVIVNLYQWAPDMAKMLDLISKKHQVFDLDGALLQDTTKPLATPSNLYSQFFNIVRG